MKLITPVIEKKKKKEEEVILCAINLEEVRIYLVAGRTDTRLQSLVSEH